MKQYLASIAFLLLVTVAVSAKKQEPLIPTCHDWWDNAKSNMNYMLGSTEDAWKNLCTMMQKNCAIKKSVSSGLIKYTYHFLYNTEELTIDSRENIEIQKKCKELLAASESS